MIEGTDLVFNTESVTSNISYKSFRTSNLAMQNSYCDHRNVNQPLIVLILFIFAPCSLLYAGKNLACQKMSSNCLFYVVDKFGTNFYHLATIG
jgi:hypothetical protein